MIYLGSDHAGFSLKEKIKSYLASQGHQVEDCGTTSQDSVDYPDYALKVAKKVSETNSIGILICGTGIGMSITANKVKGIRAAVCHNEFTAEAAKRHNDANILCLGERVVNPELAIKMVDVWLKSEFDGDKEGHERHKRRVAKMMEVENEN